MINHPFLSGGGILQAAPPGESAAHLLL